MRKCNDITSKTYGKWTVIKRVINGNYGKAKFLCRCQCGLEKEVYGITLTSGRSTQCIQCYRKNRKKKYSKYELLPTKINKLKPVQLSYRKINNKIIPYWKCLCDCGNETILPATRVATNKSKECGNCGHRWKFGNRTGYKEIMGSFWGRLKNNSKSRNLKLDISIEYAYNLLLKQNKKCALTGLDIVLASSTQEDRDRITTASIDRIDSSKGYIEGNIQWVHKDINFMKQDISQEKFFEYCKMIYNNLKSKYDKE